MDILNDAQRMVAEDGTSYSAYRTAWNRENRDSGKTYSQAGGEGNGRPEKFSALHSPIRHAGKWSIGYRNIWEKKARGFL